MPLRCIDVKLPDGTVAMARVEVKLCVHCGAVSTKLCDFPVEGRRSKKTCDRPLCDRCATHVAPDLDYCREHAPRTQQALFGSADEVHCGNPFCSGPMLGYPGQHSAWVDAASRIEAVGQMGEDDLEAVIRNPVFQKTVRAAAERRLRRLRREAGK